MSNGFLLNSLVQLISISNQPGPFFGPWKNNLPHATSAKPIKKQLTHFRKKPFSGKRRDATALKSLDIALLLIREIACHFGKALQFFREIQTIIGGEYLLA